MHNSDRALPKESDSGRNPGIETWSNRRFMLTKIWYKHKMKEDNVEALAQVLYSYSDETIDAVTDYFDETFDYILGTYNRPTRYILLAEEMVSMLQKSSTSSPAIDAIISILRRHGIEAWRVPWGEGLAAELLAWGECHHGYMLLGPIYVTIGEGEGRKEDEDVLNAAESLCSIRLTELEMI